MSYPNARYIRVVSNSALVLVTGLWVAKVEKEHAAHEAHIKEENGGHLPEVPRYPYLNIRSAYPRSRSFYIRLTTLLSAVPYPWGMNSLFFNGHVRLLSASYSYGEADKTSLYVGSEGFDQGG